MRTLHRSRPAAHARSEPTSGGPTSGGPTRSTAGPWAWFVGGAVLFFAVPFVGTDVLGLQRDWFYLLYFTVAVGWFALFLAVHGAELHDLWRPNLVWSLAVGVVAGLGVAGVVLSTAGTDHPEGWRWWFDIGWHGVVYGLVDALVLFVFPTAVAFLVMHGDRRGAGRKVGHGGLVLVLSLLMTASYHLGYPEYRDADLRSPLVGAVMASAPAVLTGNPAGAFLTHGTAHVTAVVHQSEGGPTQMLPPEVTGDYPDRGDSDVAAVLAGLWVLGLGGALVVVARRQRSRSGRPPSQRR